jgi:hypothetical protein
MNFTQIFPFSKDFFAISYTLRASILLWWSLWSRLQDGFE